MDSLSLLTTSRDPIVQPLALSWATSAATAQLSGLAAEVLADDPELWPETVRALLTHSARWTPAMEEALRSEEHTSELQSLMRISYAVFCLKKKTKNTTK